VIKGAGSDLPRVPSVPELIRARAARTNDDYTLGLTVEGGGMRGVVSGAMLIAFRDLGLAHVFDRFYGTSSGSMNLAYFAADHGWDALSVYYDYLVSGFDGGLLWPDPLYAALDEKCSHVLMLNTAPEGTRDNTSPFMAKALHSVLNWWRTGLGDAYIGGRGPWAADRKELGNAENVELRGTQVFRLCPSAGSHRVERLTVIRGELLDGARAGYTTIMNEFGQRETRAYFAVVLPIA
jgi:hypothetical protein